MRVASVLAFIGFVLPTAAEAQWTQGAAGKIWVKSALFIQQTDEHYDEFGVREPWDFQGESDAMAVFTDIIVGLHPRIDLWAQIPILDLGFRSTSIDDTRTGIGDVRAWLRWNVTSLSGATPISIRAGAKLPVGDSPVSAQVIPLGEGQWDFETWAEIGHSFWPAPVYAELWLGYRFRFANDELVRDPGEEFAWLGEVGVQPTPWSLVKTTFDGLRGGRVRQDGVLAINQRRISTLQFVGGIKTGPIWPEFGVRVPVAGRDFPAGLQWVIGGSAQIR